MKNFEVSQPVTVFGFEALISEVIDITRKPHLYGVQFNGQDKTWVVEEEHIEAVVDNRPVTERIMTFEEAYDALGEDHTLVRQYNLYMQQMHGNEDDMRDLTAYMKLRIVTEALNEDWHPTFSDEEVRYYPWFVLYTEEEYENLDDDDKARCCRVVGRSNGSASASGGLVYASANFASSYSVSSNGSRLAFKTRELALHAGKQFINLWCDFVF